MWLLELTLGLASAQAPEAVVTFDNGGFNAALYAPRYSGFARPSVAREVAAAIGRVAGSNPTVWTYLPPGRVPGRPGDAYRVEPRRAGCTGSAERPSDPCWCSPGDACWGDLDVNRHPAGSTSLYLTAARVREGATGPRIEVHFTDLFEEDPSVAENPADADKCVTRSGARKALEGLLGSGDQPIDHLAVGLLRVQIDPPPPGRDAGSTFLFREGEGGCWSGASTGRWDSRRDPIDWGMGVVVLGIGTAEHSHEVAEFLTGLNAQLNSEQMALSLVRLREPPVADSVSASISVDELAGWSPPGSLSATTLPCASTRSRASFTLDGQPLSTADGSGDCAGNLVLDLPPAELRATWARVHGLDPFAELGVVEGRVEIEGAADSMVAALDRLGEVNAEIADRPLPLWEVVSDLAQAGGGGLRTSRRDVSVRLELSGLDRRPWFWAIAISLLFGVAGAVAATRALTRFQANRAYQAAWDRAVGADEDPLRQRPVAVVLAEAQEEIRRRWLPRWIGAAGLALLLTLSLSYVLLRLTLLGVTLGG